MLGMIDPAATPRVVSSRASVTPGANRQASGGAEGRITPHATLGIKVPYPVAESAAGLVPSIEHVAAAEMTDEQLLALLRQQLHLLDQALGREIGCHHIVIAMGDKDLHVRVHARRSMLADKTLKLWDVATGALIRTFKGDSHALGRCRVFYHERPFGKPQFARSTMVGIEELRRAASGRSCYRFSSR